MKIDQIIKFSKIKHMNNIDFQNSVSCEKCDFKGFLYILQFFLRIWGIIIEVKKKYDLFYE